MSNLYGDGEVPPRKIVNLNPETITNVTSTDTPGHHYGEDNSWSLDDFRKNLRFIFHKNDPFDCFFSLIGVDAAIANAFRRILIAEIPTLSIEEVYMYRNTSIIHDEVLSHRLGLIPLRGSKEGMKWLKWFVKSTPESQTENNSNSAQDENVETVDAHIASDYNTVVLKLSVTCTWQENGKALAAQGETDPRKLYQNHAVYSRDLEFEPHGQQKELFQDEPVQAVNPDILIAKLRPGQTIEATMHCIKGIGADHAKFSPVATASYRLLPLIRILQPIIGKDAENFQNCFPKGVIKLETYTESDAREHGSKFQDLIGQPKAVVDNPILDTASRECLRHPEFKDKVKLGRVQDHFLFRIESTGQLESDELFLESVLLLKAKCLKLKQAVHDLAEGNRRQEKKKRRKLLNERRRIEQLIEEQGHSDDNHADAGG